MNNKKNKKNKEQRRRNQLVKENDMQATQGYDIGGVYLYIGLGIGIGISGVAASVGNGVWVTSWA